MTTWPLEAHGLPLVLLHLFGDVAVPQGVVLVLDLDDRGVQVEGQGVFDLVVLHLAVGVLKGDLRPAEMPRTTLWKAILSMSGVTRLNTTSSQDFSLSTTSARILAL